MAKLLFGAKKIARAQAAHRRCDLENSVYTGIQGVSRGRARVPLRRKTFLHLVQGVEKPLTAKGAKKSRKDHKAQSGKMTFFAPFAAILCVLRG
jgi:hypothetical protein